MINNIENELVIGLIGELGVDFDAVADHLSKQLSKAGYHVEPIRIALEFAQRNSPSEFATCYWKMQYATKHRLEFGNDYWAKKAVARIFKLRPTLSAKHKKIAYLVRSLKNQDELELLSNVYGRNFVAVSIFTEAELSSKHLNEKLKLNKIKTTEAALQMQAINNELGLSPEVAIGEESLDAFLLKKDQQEIHPDLREYGQNLFKCYSKANYFIYQNKNLERQIKRFVDILFNDPFAEPTFEEYFMFCAQAAAYRSLDLDRQVGAVIVNSENEMVASGFNDVSKVGGGHFFHHDHPMHDPDKNIHDQRDFKQEFDFNHKYLDHIADNMAAKLKLGSVGQAVMREEIRAVTEFKRSTHAEMSALLDASRRGVAVRDCTIYVNTYPCHNCTKHIIASGIRRVIFLHPYAKSKAREMYPTMIKHGLLISEADQQGYVIFEPFLGVSPNRFSITFANDKDTRLQLENGKENGKPIRWILDKDAIPKDLRSRLPYSYIPREWAVINNKIPDMSKFYPE